MAALSVSPERSLEFLRAGQNSDGGWGYRPGSQSFVEPTGFVLLALDSPGDECAASGLAFLRSCMEESGAIGTDPLDKAGSWMAYAALLAFQSHGAGAELSRLREWMLGLADASATFRADELSDIKKTYRYDASIPGWPWTPDTTAWVEPTALFMIALLKSGVTPDHPRIRAGIDLIVDRRVPSGGWNFGNPYSNNHELEAGLMPSALALIALAAAGYSENGTGVAKGMRFIGRLLDDDVSTASLAWSLLALNCRPSGQAMVPAVSKTLSARREQNGGFRGYLFETALAFLALEKPGLLISSIGSDR